MKIIEPCREYHDAFLAMAEEFHAAGELDWPHCARRKDNLAVDDFDAYLQRAANWSQGLALPDGWVPSSDYWLIGDGDILGTANLRHKLTPRLAYEGGHIGYCICPSQRHKGYATTCCAMMLDKARQINLKRVLLTCEKTNTTSAHIIERNGGVFEDERPGTQREGLIRRYWIEL